MIDIRLVRDDTDAVKAALGRRGVDPGEVDLLVELVCEDDDAILELLNGTIRRIPGVRDTETFMYLKLTKQTYTWGTR